MNVPFATFDQETASFYRRIIVNVMLNVHAVRMGYFDTLLCETDDIKVTSRWNEALPRIAQIMHNNKQLGLN